jgi:class 3 adenylate cyclase
MRDPPLVLIADDHADNRAILTARLASRGYAIAEVEDGGQALAAVAGLAPDLVLLDVMMPVLDGFEVTRRIRADPALPFAPIILVTALTAVGDIVRGLDAGADDYLTKPVEHAALLARVRAMLRIKALHDEVQAWNSELEHRVAAQVAELERMSRLRRFLPPQVADLVTAEGGEAALQSRRAEVTVLFSDLRGFTAFAEAAAPERVMAALAAYHGLAGPLIHAHQGTLERFLGDGLMVVFGAPLPCDAPDRQALDLALALGRGFGPAMAPACEGLPPIGIGIGIARGEATVGTIGFAGRLDYAAIGGVANLAARLCDAAADGEILVSGAVHDALGAAARARPRAPLALKGFAQPVPAWACGTS